MRVARLFATVAAATAGGLVLATPAYAATANLHNDHHDRLATYFTQQCNDERFAGLEDNEDGWHFVLPGGGEFTSISVTFDKDGVPDEDAADDVTYTGTPAVPNDFTFYQAGSDDKHAYLFTPAGYMLVNGTAQVTSGDKFNVSHTCAGEKDEQPSTSPSPSKSSSKSPSPSTSVSPTPGGNLPLTGTATGAIVVGGIALVAGGVALLAIRRRRDITAG